MLFRQQFIDALTFALDGVDYRLIGDNFYIHKPEIGLVIKFSFDVMMNGSCFTIYGGAGSYCENIKLFPDNELHVSCYEISHFESCCNRPTFDNTNYDTTGLAAKRYSKKLLAERLSYNIDTLKAHLLPELLAISDLEDYCNFKIKADGLHYYIPIPYSFYLCIALGKLREASHVYLMDMRRNPQNNREINRIMGVSSESFIFDEFDKHIDYDAFSKSGASGNFNAVNYARLDAEAKVIENILREHINPLNEDVRRITEHSREICRSFFANA